MNTLTDPDCPQSVRDQINGATHLPAGSEAVKQFRKVGCSGWYDGLPDNADGGGPYEKRTLYAAPPSTPPAANVQEGWSAHPDQTSPMTVGPEAFLDEPVASEAEAVAAAFAERNSIPHDDGSFCADLEQTLIEFAALRAKQAPTVAVPAEGTDAWRRKFELWFFRDMSNEQRLKLFSLFGLPIHEIDQSQGHQQKAIRHLFRARARAEQREAPSAVVGEVVAWTRQSDLRTLKDHWPMVAVIGVAAEKSGAFDMPLFAAAPTSDGR